MADITIQEINSRLSALIVAMLEQGIDCPRTELNFKSDQDPCAVLWGTTEQKPFLGGFLKVFTAADASAALDAASAYIAALPDLKILKLNAHMRRVADCIDKGREDGIDDAYIAPLVIVKQTMTDNLLAAPVAA